MAGHLRLRKSLHLTNVERLALKMVVKAAVMDPKIALSDLRAFDYDTKRAMRRVLKQLCKIEEFDALKEKKE